MKDLGHLSYFLGLEITFDKSGYYLSQAKYATNLISRVDITDTKVVNTPFDSTKHLAATDGTPLSDETLYRQLVGSIIYLTVTRPYVAYAFHIVSQFMSSPRTNHFSVALRILQYIRGTLFHELYFAHSSHLELQAYSDAGWADDPTDRRSTTGYCLFLGTSLISWRNTISELLWLQWLLQDMGVPASAAIPLFYDALNRFRYREDSCDLAKRHKGHVKWHSGHAKRHDGHTKRHRVT
ncbi:uncharacterized mitochondrial protein AtMg00810-like [Impatiens glandulifera]|uniref:uncharacterized mitochondrial protein AtMg00810-like n=1 Tax=Impatiens glandulifera TaxID=253017 RepID=UPI001FB08FA7|nr:uncharacterized mitochondrial protein AtMg00810-like [Impatiens glandulifera]